MATTWRLSSFESATDVKELIPEFFFLPEFLENSEGNDTESTSLVFFLPREQCRKPRPDHTEVDFQISPFSKCFASTLKRKACIFKSLRFLSSVFEKLRGRDGFSKTIGQFVEITLRFQIFTSVVWTGHYPSALNHLFWSKNVSGENWKLHLTVRYFDCLFTTFDEHPPVTDKVPFLSAVLKTESWFTVPNRYSYSNWRSLPNQTTLFAL